MRVACSRISTTTTARRRPGDRDARDGGQWGAALRWYAVGLDSEFAAYFINYHSRQPYFSTQGATTTGALSTSKYFIEYPEDIRLYSLSLSTILSTGTTLVRSATGPTCRYSLARWISLRFPRGYRR